MSRTRARHRAESLRRFFDEDLWKGELPDLGRARRAAYRALRIGHASVTAFQEQDVAARAASLTYYTVLSIVPLLALGFSVLKGLGGYDELVEHAVRPRVRETFAANPQLAGAFDTLFSFIGGTNLGSLGGLGLAFVVYTAVALVSAAASALSAIWGAARRRSLFRQITDFVSLIVLAPVGLAVAVSLVATATATSTAVVGYVHRYVPVGPLLDVLFRAVPLGVVFLALAGVYVVLPNTRGRPRSALLGAAVATALWYGALVLHVRFQVGVANYSALYSGFAAIPIFLLWVYVSWVLVLLGGTVAATHQHGAAFAQKLRLGETGTAMREALSLEAVTRIARTFMDAHARDRRPWRLDALSAALGAPDRTVAAALDALAGAGVLTKIGDGGTAVYVLGRPPEEIWVKDVLDAVRGGTRGAAAAGAETAGRGDAVRAVLRGLDRDLAASRFNATIRALARGDGAGAVGAPPPARGGPAAPLEFG